MKSIKLHLAAPAVVLFTALPPAFADNLVDQYYDIYGGRRNGYDTQYCPNGSAVEYCEFNPDTCDNVVQGRNFCSADSRDHQLCQFHGRCVLYTPAPDPVPVPPPAPAPERVVIQGGGRGPSTAYCPTGFRVENCSFNVNTCFNTQQGYDFCSARSVIFQTCNFTGVCVR